MIHLLTKYVSDTELAQVQSDIFKFTIMDRQELVSIMAKYMDGVATEPEAFATLDHLLQSRENRQIFNIASAGFNRMQPIIQQRI